MPERRHRLLAAAGLTALCAFVLHGVVRVDADHGRFTYGDILVAHPDGIQWWRPDGTLERTLGAGRPYFGLAFDGDGTLHAAYRRETWVPRQLVEGNCVEKSPPPGGFTDEFTPSTGPHSPGPLPARPCQTLWSETSWVARFSPAGNSAGDLRAGPAAGVEAPCRRPPPPPPPDPPGEKCDDFFPQAVAVKGTTVYVGAAMGSLLEVEAADTSPRVMDRQPPHVAGISHADLAPDGCTLVYTSTDPAVHRYDVCNDVPLADLTPGIPSLVAAGGRVYAVEVRSNGEVMVGSTDGVHRLNLAGAPVATYRVGTAKRFFAVALDPDNETFWTATSDGDVYRLRISDGLPVGSPLRTGVNVLGLAVRGGQPPPPPPTPPTLTVDDGGVNEGGVNQADAEIERIEFPVRLSQASSQPVTVKYATANGEAIAGADYNAAQGTLQFTPGDTVEFIPVEIVDDTADEPDERFTLNLSEAAGATIAKGAGTVTITDNDDPAGTPPGSDPGPAGGGSNQPNQQTRVENAPPSGTTGGGGTAPSPVNAPSALSAPSPVQAPLPVAGAAPVPGVAPVASPSPVAVGSAAPVSSPLPIPGAAPGPAPAGVPGALVRRSTPAPAAGELRPGRPSGVRNHEMVRHSATGDDEAGTTAATVGATLLFGCFVAGVVWSSRRREVPGSVPAWCESRRSSEASEVSDELFNKERQRW